MQTNFTLAQLADAAVRESEAILRKCVHCGFCLATCPTYTLLGDERDSPRGRIYLIKEMLEQELPADRTAATHIDRCLSCLSCMTTCPSGVNYMHLVDHARAHVERTWRRPWRERALRTVLAKVLPYPARLRAALWAARLARPLAPLLPAELRAMLALAPARRPAAPPAAPRATQGRKVALLPVCAQGPIAPEIDAATVRVLERHGFQIVRPMGAGCCGALVHHLGREDEALAFARRNVRAFDDPAIEFVVVNASGCGTTVKDYGFMLREDAEYAAAAQRVAAKTRDITEVLAGLDLRPTATPKPALVYHSACSMQHGQKLHALPKDLLRRLGFTLAEPAEGHLCCGSAGTYNLLQPELAGQLRDRKAANLRAAGAGLVATGNIGCITQLRAAGLAVTHSVELVDWATGGPAPAALAERGGAP